MKIQMYIKNLNREIAFNATHNLILVCGAIAIFDFVFSLRWFWIPFAMLVLAGMWFVIYKFEIAYRTQRLERFNYD